MSEAEAFIRLASFGATSIALGFLIGRRHERNKLKSFVAAYLRWKESDDELRRVQGEIAAELSREVGP